MDAVPASPSLGPALDFLRVLWRVNHGMARRSRQMQSAIGLTAQQRMVIRLVGRFPELSATELAQLLHVDPGTLSSVLGRLESSGYIRRTADASDGRRVRLLLTARGRRFDHEEEGTIEDAVARVLAGASGQDAPVAQRMLSALAAELTHSLQDDG